MGVLDNLFRGRLVVWLSRENTTGRGYMNRSAALDNRIEQNSFLARVYSFLKVKRIQIDFLGPDCNRIVMFKIIPSLLWGIMCCFVLTPEVCGAEDNPIVKFQWLKSISPGVDGIDFVRKIPVKLKGAARSEYRPETVGGDVNRIIFKKVSPQSYAIFDVKRLTNMDSSKAFQLSLYSQGGLSLGTKPNIVIESSADGVTYHPHKLVAKKVRSFRSGKVLYYVKPNKDIKSFRYLKIYLANLDGAWKISLGYLILSAMPIKDFVIPELTPETQKTPPVVSIQPAPLPDIYKSPVSMRKSTEINNIQGVAFKDDDVDVTKLAVADLDWKKVKLPSKLLSIKWEIPGSSNKDNCALYRFLVKQAENKSMRIFLVIPCSSFVTTLYIDDKVVKTTHEGTLPLCIDVSKYISGPGNHMFMLKVRNYKAGISDSGSFIQPLGAVFRYRYGLGGAPRLLCLPKSYLRDPYVRSSIAEKEVHADVDIVEPSAAQILKADIMSKDGKVIFSSRPIKLSASKVRGQFKFNVGNSLKKWDIGKPNLYTLRFKLYNDGKLIDELPVQFGYRSVEIKGEDIYLNGRKVFLIGPWAHVGEWIWARPGGDRKGKSSHADIFRIMLERNINIVRLHCQVYDEIFYQAADEAGILLIAESNLNHRPKTGSSLEHIEKMVKYLRNHPSIVIWSGSNEFEHWISPRPDATSGFMLKVQDIFHKYDPNRPVMHSGYGDAFGKLDIYNIHYPESNAPEFPRSLYWKKDMKLENKHYITNYERYSPVGKKPLAIGEQLTPNNSLSLEHVYGDKVYQLRRGDLEGAIKYEEYLGEFWREVIRIYKEQNVALLSPNFMYLPDAVDSRFLQIISRELSMQRAYIKELYPGLTAGKNTRTLVLFNSSATSFQGTAGLKLDLAGKTVWRDVRKINMKSSSIDYGEIAIDVQSAENDEKGKLTVELFDKDGKLVYSMFREVKYYAGMNAPALQGKVVIMSGDGPIAHSFRSMGLDVDVFKGWDRLSLESMLVIPSGVSGTEIGRNAIKMIDFVKRGGRILILAREEIPYVFPVELKVTGGIYPGATAGFIRAPFHPLFSKGFYKYSNLDFRFWPQDNLICNAALYKPESGNFICLIDGGIKLVSSLLTELPYGKGTIVSCQIRTSGNSSSLPVSQRLLYSLAEYMNGNNRVEADQTGWIVGKVENYASDLLLRLGWRKYQGSPSDNIKLQAVYIDDKSIDELGEQTIRAIAGNAKYVYMHCKDINMLQKMARSFTGTAPEQQKLPDFRGNKRRSVNIWNSFVVRDPIFDGLTGSDLNWFARIPKTAFSFRSSNGWTAPAYPLPFAVHRSQGRTFIVDMSIWNQEVDHDANRKRYLCMLSTNMGVKLASIKVRNVSTSISYKPIHLLDKCNASASKYLGNKFPSGKIALRGIPFNFINSENDKQSTMIRLNSRCGTPFENKEILYDTPIDRFEEKTPPYIRIPVNRIQAETIYFAHTSSRNWKIISAAPVRTKRVCSYRINYSNGTSVTIPVNLGSEINDSRNSAKDGRNMIAGLSFQNSANGQGEIASISVFPWVNPHPEYKIGSIDIVSASNIPYDPMLFAITYKEFGHKFE